jgi:hypothetical protein
VRVSFNEVFSVSVTGMITPKHIVRIGGVQMGPGVSMGGGVAIGNLQLGSIVGHDLEVEQGIDGVVTVTGHYAPGM